MTIIIIDGPNLNLLGKREPEIYGHTPTADYLRKMRPLFPDVNILYFQSNHEGEIIDTIQKFGYDDDCVGIVINPGAYSHYSIAIADAVRAVDVSVVEVHISNVFGREAYRRNMVTAEAASAIIAGAGLAGYKLAVEYLLEGARD